MCPENEYGVDWRDEGEVSEPLLECRFGSRHVRLGYRLSASGYFRLLRHLTDWIFEFWGWKKGKAVFEVSSEGGDYSVAAPSADLCHHLPSTLSEGRHSQQAINA